MSGEIPQHLVVVADDLRRRLRRWPPLERSRNWLRRRFTTWPADDFTRFTRSARPQRPAASSTALPPSAPPPPPPAALSLAPATFEQRFLELHRRGGFEEMWDLLAEDAQRSWGHRRVFVDRMRSQAGDFEVVDASVGGVSIVPEWTDSRSHRTYQNVAELVVRYRVRQGWQDLALDRQVHLIPAAGGWRTLYYPAD